MAHLAQSSVLLDECRRRVRVLEDRRPLERLVEDLEAPTGDGSLLQGEVICDEVGCRSISSASRCAAGREAQEGREGRTEGEGGLRA